MRWALCAAVGLVGLAVSVAGGEGSQPGQPTDSPKVRPDRPRIFLRAGGAADWDGPSLAKIKGWLDQPEYKERLAKLAREDFRKEADTSAPVNDALLYLLKGDAQAGQRAADGLKKFEITGDTPSYRGIEAQKMAALYDWLHDHPALDDASRKACRERMEKYADAELADMKKGGPSTPFYSRVPGSLSGVTLVGLALFGESEKAKEYVAYTADHLKTKLGTIRQMEDGATGGGSYGLHHEFTDLANTVAAWRSATDWDAGKWIKENQGNWLERQMIYQMWITYPNGWFVKHGDIWSGSHADRQQFTMQFGPVSGMYQNGLGRSWMAEIHKRWGLADYHISFLWEWFVFNNPDIKARPLSELGKAEVFSPKLHGIVCWRSGWEPDATIVHFMAGETVDHHGTYDEGKFLIFKRAPLAIKSGSYLKYLNPAHLYYKSPWSANCVVFTGDKVDGMQPHVGDYDFFPSWKEWQAERAKHFKDKAPPGGHLLVTEANDKFARAVSDLAGAVPADCGWVREIVFLDYQYVIVLDRVKTAPGISARWTLHTINQPKVDDKLQLATADNGDGRLFCKTLLPAKAELKLVGGPGHEFDYNGANRPPGGYKGLAKEKPEMQYGEWRLDVTPSQVAPETVYLHVLYPADTKTDQMPDCSVEQKGAEITVKVGERSHTFAR